MTTLHLGVTDIPYSNDPEGKTTGDVAEILEDKYGVMEAFWRLHGQEVGDAMASSLQGALESMAMGAPGTFDPTGSAMAECRRLFEQFITLKQMDGLAEGVPTAASLAGVSHRFKNKKGAPGRPSFVDTGAYLGAFRSWIDTETA